MKDKNGICTIQLRITTGRVLPNILPRRAGNSSKTQLGRQAELGWTNCTVLAHTSHWMLLHFCILAFVAQQQ
jgi:hypothetical protein